MNISELGQVFTPPEVVEAMLELRRNFGSVLEPSAGEGAFMRALKTSATGIELDAGVIAEKRIQNGDFFAYPLKNRFDTIIGNPPYVRYRDIRHNTKRLLPMGWFDHRSNLYLFFIAKCMHHLNHGGEFIIINPRAFLTRPNSKRLHK